MTIEDVRKARKGIRISNMDEFSLRSGVQEILREVATMNGLDYTLAVNYSSLLYAKLRSEHGGLTLDEVQLAFRAGTEEEFGKNYAITYATLIRWIKGYLIDRRVVIVQDEERAAGRRTAETLWSLPLAMSA